MIEILKPSNNGMLYEENKVASVILSKFIILILIKYKCVNMASKFE